MSRGRKGSAARWPPPSQPASWSSQKFHSQMSLHGGPLSDPILFPKFGPRQISVEISIVALHRRSPWPGGRKQSQPVVFSFRIISVLSQQELGSPCLPPRLLARRSRSPAPDFLHLLTFPTSTLVLPFVPPLRPDSGSILTLPFTSEIGLGSARSSYVTARPFGMWGAGADWERTWAPAASCRRDRQS